MRLVKRFISHRLHTGALGNLVLLTYLLTRPEQSHLLPEACSSNDTENRQQRQRQKQRPSPETTNNLRRLCALYDDKIRYYKKKVSKSCSLLTLGCPSYFANRKRPRGVDTNPLDFCLFVRFF